MQPTNVLNLTSSNQRGQTKTILVIKNHYETNQALIHCYNISDEVCGNYMVIDSTELSFAIS